MRRAYGYTRRMSDIIATQTLPHFTADIPGISGVIKRYDEDFVVEELPRYEACGQGTHTYFCIEKHGLSTHAAIGILSKALGKRERDFGYAGLKDAHGLTRQMISIEHVAPSIIAALELRRIKVLSTSQHTNKIKLGHLRGNHFIIRIRDVKPHAIENTRLIMEVLQRRGMVNYFGPQRFGVRGDNAAIGRAVLLDHYDEAIALLLGRTARVDSGAAREARDLFDAGDLEASAKAWEHGFRDNARVCRILAESDRNTHKAWRAVNHSMRKLYFSALQSELFNQVIASRIHSIDKLVDGDVAWKHKNGACFGVEDATVEQPRCDAFEISPTGPLFGKKMKEPTGTTATIEESILAGANLRRDQINSPEGKKLDGGRRPLRVPLTDVSLEEGQDHHGPYLQVSFTLPPGSYATVVTREICKHG